jgi:hypothetical protein
MTPTGRHGHDLRDEEGVTVLIVALSMAVLFGMVVLAVDLGALIVKHRGLVNANDSAALAAAASFARNEGEAAATQADRFARENLPDAEHDTDWWTVVAGLQTSGCDPSTCGSVKVKYQAGQALFFAPALGLSDNVTAHGTATAIWGPAGGGEPVPIALNYDWLSDRCATSVPNDSPPTECAFWLDGRQNGDGDDDDDGGNGQWAWINLKECPGPGCGWDTGSAGFNCPNISSSELRNWIRGEGPDVAVNQAPTPTFVCTGGGAPADFFDDLRSLGGNLRQFPVNDAAGRFAHGQVDDDGDPCPPDSSCTPAQYDIVGFTVLRIEQVIPGDQDGLPGGTFDCSWEDVDLQQGFPVFLSDQPCPWQDLHYPNDPDKRFPAIRKGGQRYNGETVGNCPPPEFDYCYDPGTSEISWQRPDPVEDATIEWQYDVEPTPGECGVHELDPSAVCLVASWQGYRTGGINPGVGIDFGLRAVRLFE